ncbi:hypothetical protein K456DRAFT_354589 [Colletotrichum gloeosporioides 23]|nr:hypothetical protein K456DRAFT_354589 [Colletotrichum gloeosporioides 23]
MTTERAPWLCPWLINEAQHSQLPWAWPCSWSAGWPHVISSSSSSSSRSRSRLTAATRRGKTYRHTRHKRRASMARARYRSRGVPLARFPQPNRRRLADGIHHDLHLGMHRLPVGCAVIDDSTRCPSQMCGCIA